MLSLLVIHRIVCPCPGREWIPSPWASPARSRRAAVPRGWDGLVLPLQHRNPSSQAVGDQSPVWRAHAGSHQQESATRAWLAEPW